MKVVAQRALLVAASGVLVVIVWLLIESRPPFPAGTNLTSTSNLDRLLGWLAWLGGLLLTLGLIGRIVSHHSSDFQRRVSVAYVRPRRRPISQHVIGGYARHAFPLILRPRTSDDALVAHPTADHPRAQHELTRDGEEVSACTRVVRISVLGQLDIEGGRRHGRRLRGPTRDLLAYLALHPNGAHRDQLIDELWFDQSPEQARNRLYRAAADARAHFGDTTVIRRGDHYRLNRALVWIDLDQLEQHQAALAQTQTRDEELRSLRSALALFRGEPFAGSDLPWAETQQRRLHALRLELLERAGRNSLGRRDPSGALTDAEAGLAEEPYNENLARLAMQAEAALGLRGAVIKRYESLRALLEQELGLQPQRETRILYHTLLGQDPAH